jgi:hypothetical protein
MPDDAITGFAWFVKHTPGTAPDPQAVPWGGTPVPRFSWSIGPKEPGVHHRYGGHAFVAVTGEALPPEVRPGWEVEPAALDPDFDTAGARLIREAGYRETPLGRVTEYVFEVAGAAGTNA